MIGPEKIEPDVCPLGIVFHVYDRDEKCLVRRGLNAISDVEEAATIDRLFAEAVSVDGFLIVVAYDGDTGERMGMFWSEPLT